jgi:hypothetical protein
VDDPAALKEILMSMEGGCLCGAIRYRIDGPARKTTHCHCLHCQRASGAPFVTWTEFRASEFTIVSGTPARYESRPQVTRQFCSRCGAQLTYQHAEDPGAIDVTTCSLDDAEAVTPEDHVWCDRMVSWVKIADGLPRYRRSRSAK